MDHKSGSKSKQDPTGEANKKSNVIDMTERIDRPDFREYLKGLKVRFDLENTKVAVSTSLLSIVVLVTLANNNLLSTITPISGSLSQSSEAESTNGSGRGIASVSLSEKSPDAVAVVGTHSEENPLLIRKLSNRDLGPTASVGKKPSALERLAYGFLEGRYAVRLKDGFLKEIELAEGLVEEAKSIESSLNFIDSQRELLPGYDHVVKVGVEKDPQGSSLETFQLVNQVSIPVAKVQVKTSDTGRLVAVSVSTLQLAFK